MKMSRIRRQRVKQILQAWEQQSGSMGPWSGSWAEARDLIAYNKESWKQIGPELLIALANLEPSGIADFREEFSGTMLNETDADILRISDQLKVTWNGQQEDIERQVHQWFQEVPLDRKQHRWLVIHQLGIIMPLFQLSGSVAQEVFRWSDRCRTCSNPACKGRRFLAKRADQKYCLATDECRKYGHRLAARLHYQKGKM